jgi:hypothetical protein
LTLWACITRSYRFVDYATQAYLLLVGILILFFHSGRVPHFHHSRPFRERYRTPERPEGGSRSALAIKSETG